MHTPVRRTQVERVINFWSTPERVFGLLKSLVKNSKCVCKSQALYHAGSNLKWPKMTELGPQVVCKIGELWRCSLILAGINIMTLAGYQYDSLAAELLFFIFFHFLFPLLILSLRV